MDEQSTFLTAEQPPEPEAAPLGQIFETTVAVKGGVMTVEVEDAPGGPMMTIQVVGGVRKPAPIRLDRFQARALFQALAGATDAIMVAEGG